MEAHGILPDIIDFAPKDISQKLRPKYNRFIIRLILYRAANQMQILQIIEKYI